ncbi:hypothetical protein AAAT94_08300 [Intestinimonas aquisgranensis]|nr:hypothetical protein [Intestinimonas aquisgranensis]
MKLALLVTACIVLLSGCGQQTSGTPVASTEPSPTQTTAPISTEHVETEEVVFNATPDDFIQALAAYVEDTASVSPLDITPESEPWEPSEDAVSGTYYSYAIHDGFSVNIIDSTQSGKIQSVSVTAVSDSLDVESARDLGCYQAAIVAMFEPDQDTLSTIDADLNIAETNFSEDNIYFSTGSIASYMYVISDGFSMLSIDPL